MADTKIAIMQPYLFPYIGYFQLISAVDEFVLYDDVQWIKGGWINRNRIQIRGKPHFVTVPVSSEGNLKPIHLRRLADSYPHARHRILAQLEDAYLHAPHYAAVRNLVADCLSYSGVHACELIIRSISRVCSLLDLNTPITRSSELPQTKARGVHRVIEIVKHFSGTTYINAIGGRDLYSETDFHEAGLKLKFLKTGDVRYRQFDDSFLPSLSIIDVLMFNSPQETRKLLENFELIQ